MYGESEHNGQVKLYSISVPRRRGRRSESRNFVSDENLLQCSPFVTEEEIVTFLHRNALRTLQMSIMRIEFDATSIYTSSGRSTPRYTDTF